MAALILALYLQPLSATGGRTSGSSSCTLGNNGSSSSLGSTCASSSRCSIGKSVEETFCADTTADWVMSLRETRVTAKRPMKEIGLEKSTFDSIALKENISLSMADILTFNAPVFVKSYGRATLSTIAFRGTSASHTQVTWNDMKINSPMLGMTDFSTIPAYFIDDAALLHGTSSVNQTGGGLGGAVQLATKPLNEEGLGLQFVQGIGSFSTFDDFLRVTWGDKKWQISTRIVFSTSKNNFKYRNHDKKENIYDSQHNIIGKYYPTERNKSGAFRDLHILQEFYRRSASGDLFGVNIWYINSYRELPLLTTDYSQELEFENRQRENTLRALLSWERMRSRWRLNAKAGYIYSWLGYDYKRDPGNGIMSTMTRSRSKVHTMYASLKGEYSISPKWFFTTDISLHQHFVESADKNIILTDGGDAIVGYSKAREELSGSISLKWQPLRRLGLSAVVREELYGKEFTPPIPALFADFLISERWNLVAKGSVSKNYRYPTLNDHFFLPGGNPNLKSESGVTYDVGLSFGIEGKRGNIKGGVNHFNSNIDDWIIWLPTTKGFFSPKNVKKVQAYGIESNMEIGLKAGNDFKISLMCTFAWTASINKGDPVTPADQSAGKQLPYIPEYSASANGRISWRAWSLLYKWCYYSSRYTMSSNDITLTGRLTPYYMNNIAVERSIKLPFAQLSLKGCINNLFNEEYLSVLSRPMPGINFEFYVGITPLFRKR